MGDGWDKVRIAPLSATARIDGPGADITMETTLKSVNPNNQNYHLTLFDGSKWFVNPADLPTVALWLPSAAIRVTKATTQYWKLTNLDDEVSVTATRV
jgi:hypothetical protein